jgi:uncharacterized cupredoxin-like copper-binding protein
MSKTPPSEDAPAFMAVFKGMEIEAEQTVAPAGDVHVIVLNEAALPHNFLLIRTDLPADRLPMHDGSVATEQLEVVGAVGEVEPGGEGTAIVHLEPGRHLLICDEPGHYERTAGLELTVQPAERSTEKGM